MAATAGGLVYAILPYSVYYGRVILPEPFMVFWAVFSVYLIYSGEERGGDWGDWGKIGLGGWPLRSHFLSLQTAWLFLHAACSILFVCPYGFSLRLLIGLFVYSLITFFPIWWWRQWILQYPEGIPVYAWLLNEGNIRFKEHGFIGCLRSGWANLILGVLGTHSVWTGHAYDPIEKEGWVFRLWVTVPFCI